MKYFYCSLFLFLSLYSQIHAQKSLNTEIDSIFTVVKEAFELSQKSRYGEAIELSHKILEYEHKNKNDTLRARTYNVIGISYAYLKDTSQALEYFNKSKEVYEQMKDTALMISAYNNIGVFYRDFRSNLEKSNMYFGLASNIANLSHNPKKTIHPNFNIAVNLIHNATKTNNEDDSKKAILYLTNILELLNDTSDKKLGNVKASTYQYLGYANYIIKNKALGDEYFEKAIEYSKENGYLHIISNIYFEKADLFEAEKNFKKANEMLNLYILVKDSIYEVEKYELAKKIEADNFLKENKKELAFIKKEKKLQDTSIRKAKIYNFLFASLSIVLLLLVYYIFKKNKELQLAKDKAEKLSRVKSDFYSEISHELRTPLYAVIELSKLLLQENINSIHKEYLESLNFSGSHLLSLINNVLELNKVESGKIKIEYLNFSPRGLIINIIESLEYALRNSNNKIHLHYDKNIPDTLVGDSLKLSQVFINLITNAIKFTSNGNIYVVAKLIKEYETEVKILFEVKDNGIGIPKEKQIQIFEDFYQENSKSVSSYKGTGLGLSIVKRTLLAMGSEIHIDSEVNKGTSFDFELIFSKGSKKRVKEVSDESLLEDLIGKRVLVVDDNKINLLVTKKILDKFNLTSKVVYSGKEAIDILQNENFDCILMDLHMPELDGFETTKLIREFNTVTPVVALTASSTEGIKEKISKYNMCGYILKPFLTSDFIETIHTVIIRN